MKCNFCGNEVEVGSVYCNKCGKEVLIVPEYNLLDDDILQSLLDEKENKDSLKTNAIEEDDFIKEKEESKKNTNFFMEKIWNIKKNRIIFIVVSVLLVIAIAMSVFFTSYTYKMIRGSNFDEKEKYEKAIECYESAIKKKKDSIEARVAIANDYMILEEYDKAEEILLEALFINKDSSEVYSSLIMLYTIQNDNDKLEELKANAPNAFIKKLFDTAVVSAPTFSVPSGKYNDDQKIIINSGLDTIIYYSLDGSMPDSKTGKRYNEPIEIKSGKTELKAIAYNKDGDKSIVSTAKYEINYEAPDYPDVYPSSGKFIYPTKIVIKAKDDDSSIYYTWDGSSPNGASNLYVEPIDVPEGNNILSIIVVDKHGMISNILKCNYEYTP